MTEQIYGRVLWSTEVKDWNVAFYPSLVKKISRSDEFFSDQIVVSVDRLNQKDYSNIFFPLYEQEIASKTNYLYIKYEQRDKILKKISEGVNFKFMSFRHNKSYCGGMIFTETGTRLSVSQRAFDKKITRELKSTSTLPQWAEKKIFEYAKDNNFELITRGLTPHPIFGRTGLVTFKLKTGYKPKVSLLFPDSVEVDISEVQNKQTTIIFTSPNDSGFFTKSHIIPGQNNNPELEHEARKVMTWAGFTQ